MAEREHPMAEIAVSSPAGCGEALDVHGCHSIIAFYLPSVSASLFENMQHTL